MPMQSLTTLGAPRQFDLSPITQALITAAGIKQRQREQQQQTGKDEAQQAWTAFTTAVDYGMQLTNPTAKGYYFKQLQESPMAQKYPGMINEVMTQAETWQQPTKPLTPQELESQARQNVINALTKGTQAPLPQLSLRPTAPIGRDVLAGQPGMPLWQAQARTYGIPYPGQEEEKVRSEEAIARARERGQRGAQLEMPIPAQAPWPVGAPEAQKDEYLKFQNALAEARKIPSGTLTPEEEDMINLARDIPKPQFTFTGKLIPDAYDRARAEVAASLIEILLDAAKRLRAKKGALPSQINRGETPTDENLQFWLNRKR